MSSRSRRERPPVLTRTPFPAARAQKPPVDAQPAIQRSTTVVDWCRNMLASRSLTPDGRQKRVLTKRIHRTTSLQNESDEKSTIPTYVYPIVTTVLLFIVPTKFLTITAIVLTLIKKCAFPFFNAYYDRYFKNHQSNGPTFREKCYYYLDYWISTHQYAKAIVLLALTCALIFTSGSLISCIAHEPWFESLWAAALGSGLDWGFVNSNNSILRFIAVCTNVGGLVLTALLLSIISDAVQTKYDSLRKGESVVTEVQHTLIIGWSVKALSVITQLAKSSSSIGKRNSVIVCLTDQREKEDMEHDISEHDFNFLEAGVQIVCRSGSPLNYHELRKVSFSRARSIIILGDDEGDAETSDARSLQILLSIVVALEREKASLEATRESARQSGGKNDTESNAQTCDVRAPAPDRIVIEVMDTENAGIMKSVCPDLVEPVLAHDVVGRLLLQAARNPLVADVWQELLGFDGCEIYSAQWGIMRGLSFGEVLLCFEDAIPLGVKTNSGELLLNPDDSYVIGNGDEIVVLAEDKESYHASISHPLIRETVPDDQTPSGYRYVEICPGGLKEISKFQSTWVMNSSLAMARLSSKDSIGKDVERILFCGWRFDMRNLLQVFAAVAPSGSEFWILSEVPVEQRQLELRLRGWDNSNRIKVLHRVGSCRRNVLAHLPLETFTSVIVGCAEPSMSPKKPGLKARRDGNNDDNGEGAGGPDARVITVAMMIQDIVSRRNTEPKNQSICVTSGPPEDFDETRQSSDSMPFPRSATTGLARARSQKFLGSKNRKECTAPRGVIVGEIVDSRSRAMLSMVDAIDAVVASSELISKAVAMVSEDSSVNDELNMLFDPYDSEITLEGVDRYVDVARNERVSFFELMARGRQLGTIVMGYLERELLKSDTAEKGTIRYTDVALNPPNKDLRRGWHPDDLLIVLTQGTSERASTRTDGPSDFLDDIEEVKTLDITREFSWEEEVCGGKRAKVRFNSDEL